MLTWTWVMASIAAASGLIVSMWNWIKSLFLQFRLMFFIEAEVAGNSLVSAVRSELVRSWKVMGHRKLALQTSSCYIARLGHYRQIVFDVFHAFTGKTGGTILFWRVVWLHRWGRRWPLPQLLWVTVEKQMLMQLSGIRGTIDLEDFVSQANELANDWDDRCRKQETSSRHFIEWCTGTAGSPMARWDPMGRAAAPSQIGGPPPSADAYDDCHPSHYMISLRAVRPLGYSWDELNLQGTKQTQELGRLALSGEMQRAVVEFEHWLYSREWYEARCIPWRRGWLLAGPMGNGKTSMARAMARHYDLPLFILDLATLTNKELRERWSRVREMTPSIVLIEDIDCIYHGRENATRVDDIATFDALLQCFDGVEDLHGVFAMVTTNHIELVDEALKNRPGRIDSVLHIGPPDLDGLCKIANRILRDYPEEIDELVRSSLGESAASFTNRANQLALDRHWADKAIRSNGHAPREQLLSALVGPPG